MIELDINGNRINKEVEDICMSISEKYNLSPCSDGLSTCIFLEETTTGEYFELSLEEVNSLIVALGTARDKLGWLCGEMNEDS